MSSTRQRIENYLRNQLSADERDAFLREVETNTELRKELRTAEFAEKAVSQYASQRKDKLFIKQALQKNHLRQRNISRIVGLAAAALVAGLVVYLPSLLNPPPPTQQAPQGPQALFEQYYAPYRPEGSLLGGSDTDTLMARYGRLRQAYLRDQCDSVRVLAPGLLEQATFVDAPEARLLLAHCLLQTSGNEQKALQELALVPPAAADYFAEAQWYSALVHLKLGDKQAARTLLQTILANQNHPYFTQATAGVQSLGPESGY